MLFESLEVLSAFMGKFCWSESEIEHPFFLKFFLSPSFGGAPEPQQTTFGWAQRVGGNTTTGERLGGPQKGQAPVTFWGLWDGYWVLGFHCSI